MRIRYKLASFYLIIGLCVSMIALFEGLAIYCEYLNGLKARKDSAYPFEVQLELSGVSQMDRDSFEEIWRQEKYRSLNVKMKGPFISTNESSYKWELTLLLASNIPERIWLTNAERLYLPEGEHCVAARRNRYRLAEYEDGNRYISLEDQERFLVTGEIGVQGSDIQDGMLVMRFEAFPERWEPLPDEYVQTAEIHRQFWNEMKSLEGVGRFGAYCVYNNEDESVEKPSSICIAGDLWELCRLPLAFGSIEQIKIWDQEGARPVIIGNALGKKYRVGDIFSIPDPIYGRQTDCIVAGILKKGAQWFARYYIFSQRDLVPLDYTVLCPGVIPEGEAQQESEELSFEDAAWWNNMMAGCSFVYETDADADPSEVEHRVEAAMKACGMIGAVERADKLLGEMKYAAKTVCGRQRTFGILVMCVAGMYILTAGMIQFLNRRREFGIAVSCGFARRQIWLAQLAEYAVLIFASMALALRIRTAECAYLIQRSGNDVLLLSHHMDTAPRVGLCAAVLFLGCMDHCSEGEYYLNDRPVHTMKAGAMHQLRKKYISYIFQNFGLMDEYTVYENIEMPLLAQKVPRQKRRGLDRKNGFRLMDILSQIHERGKTIILVTHDPEIASYAERIIEMKDGKIIRNRW